MPCRARWEAEGVGQDAGVSRKHGPRAFTVVLVGRIEKESRVSSGTSLGLESSVTSAASEI